MRRYLAMALIAMGFSLVGCGSQQESSDTSVTAADTQNAVTQEAAAQGEDAEAKTQGGSGWRATGTVDFVCPYSAGGGSDYCARLLGEIMTSHKFTDAVVVVNNQSGGGGTVGDAYTAAKKGDDNTITTFATGQIASQIANGTTVLWSDLTPLAILATEEMTIGVRAGDTNFQTFEDLTVYSKAHPGEVTIGGSGTGTDDNVVVGLLNLHTDADVTYVPYDSTGEVMTALLGGHISAGVFNPNECASQVESKTVSILCSFGAERVDNPLFAEVRTLQEMGYEDIDFKMFRAVSGAPDMSPEAREYWIEVFRQVAQQPEWTEDYLKKNGLSPMFLAGDQAEAFLEEQYNTILKIMEEMGLAK